MTDKYAMRGPPCTDEKAPADFDPRRGGQIPYPSNRQHPLTRVQRSFIMSNLQGEPSNDNLFMFVGTVGRFGVRQTDHGPAIDIADNSCQPCRWYDAVPTNPEILPGVYQGVCVQVVVHKLLKGNWGYHPTISATLQWLPDASDPAVQLRLC